MRLRRPFPSVLAALALAASAGAAFVACAMDASSDLLPSPGRDAATVDGAPPPRPAVPASRRPEERRRLRPAGGHRVRGGPVPWPLCHLHRRRLGVRREPSGVGRMPAVRAARGRGVPRLLVALQFLYVRVRRCRGHPGFRHVQRRGRLVAPRAHFLRQRRRRGRRRRVVRCDKGPRTMNPSLRNLEIAAVSRRLRALDVARLDAGPNRLTARRP